MHYYCLMQHITTDDLAALTAQLEEEQRALEEELKEHGRKVDGDWQGTAQGFETDESDDVDEADKMEELATNVPLVETLEQRLKEVRDALKKMDNGTYGLDEKTGEPIATARLFANPAARANIA